MKLDIKYKIKPLEGAGFIDFGMTSDSVRKKFGVSFKSFKRTKESIYPCDYYENLGVFIYYKEPYVVEAIEFATPAKPTFDGKNLLDMTYEKLKKFLLTYDENLEIEIDSLTSYKLGIGIYAPNAEESSKSPIESVIVFDEDYYKL